MKHKDDCLAYMIETCNVFQKLQWVDKCTLKVTANQNMCELFMSKF